MSNSEGLRAHIQPKRCPNCNGTGYYGLDRCDCDGYLAALSTEQGAFIRPCLCCMAEGEWGDEQLCPRCVKHGGRKGHPMKEETRAVIRPTCSECGVAIDEHPLTDACALAQEARGGGSDAVHLAAIDPPAFVLCGRPAMTWTEKPSLSPVRAWTLNPEQATCVNCLYQQAERDAGRVHVPVRIARKVAP